MRDVGVDAAIAANRFGLGARPGELAAITGDPRGWLTAQLQGVPPQIVDPALQSSVYVVTTLEEMQRANREARAQASMAGGQAAVPAAVNRGAVYRPQYIAEVTARLRQGVTTDRPFLERITQFWTNHFAVSVDKGELLGVAGSYEREAIRPNVLGTFSNLLLAVETHPAMLLYLDNFRSVGPDSQAALAASRRGRRDLGINENLAREILELHTLGVDAGYTQADVTAFARVITGWSIGSENGGLAGGGIPGAYQFRPALHEPGAQTIVGRRYAQDGEGQGRAVLEDLARSPATARHIATKLARHFIADQPSDHTVRGIARAFLDSEGHLPAVYRAVVEQSQAWEQPLARYKTPNDYVFSVYRGLGLPVAPDHGAQGAFDNLGQRTWSPASPAGWPDRDADWDGASALMKRLQWAQQLGQRQGGKLDAREIAPQLLGGTLTPATRTAVEHAASAPQALTLLLASPEFMRR